MEQNRKMYGEIIKEREYRKLIFATVINRFGDSVDAIAFTWLVYQITHSAAWSAIVFALNTLPNVVVQPFAGAIVEKMDKKHVIVATHLLRAVIITLFALLYRAGLVNALVMAIFTLVITTVESFNLPATSAFTIQVVKKEHMTCGMSLNSMLSSAASLAGTGAAGVIIATAGVSAAMMIDVVTFGVAAVLISAMKAGKVKVTEATQNEATAVCGNLEYTLKYVDSPDHEGQGPAANSTVQAGDLLEAGETRTVLLKLYYKKTATVAQLPSDDIAVSNLGFTLTYNQK